MRCREAGYCPSHNSPSLQPSGKELHKFGRTGGVEDNIIVQKQASLNSMAFVPFNPVVGALARRNGPTFTRPSLSQPRLLQVLVTRRCPACVMKEDSETVNPDTLNAGTVSTEVVRSETADTGVPGTEEEDEPLVSAESILGAMRADVAQENGLPRPQRTGVTRDADGKSNIWAVEPSVAVDDKPQLNKALLLGVALVFVILAIILLPSLPLTNMDQF